MCVHFRVCSLCSPLSMCVCVCVCICRVCRYVAPPPLACLTIEKGWVRGVCVFYVPFSPNSGVKGPGLPLFFQGLGAQEQVGRVCDLVVCLLPLTVASLGSQMPSLCSPPTTE